MSEAAAILWYLFRKVPVSEPWHAWASATTKGRLNHPR